MTILDSVRRCESKLADALEALDWVAADRWVERLKEHLLTAVATNEPEQIAIIRTILSDVGEVMELRQGLEMREDATSTAWRLRADAATAALAARLRPLLPSIDDIDATGDLRTMILDFLRKANRPPSNTVIARIVNRDPATVSRMLRRLVAEGLVRQWKAGKFTYNTLTEKGRGLTHASPIERFALATDAIVSPGRRIVAGAEFSRSLFNSTDSGTAKGRILSFSDNGLTVKNEVMDSLVRAPQTTFDDVHGLQKANNAR